MAHPFGRSLLLPLAAATLAASGFGFVLMDRRADQAKLLQREAALKARVRILQLHNSDLAIECRGLATNASVEQVARDSYGFCAPDEVAAAFDLPPRPPYVVRRPPPGWDDWTGWLGQGGFPWRVPAMAFAVSLLVLCLLKLLEQPSPGPSADSQP